MSAGPIPFSAIDAYARRHEIDGEDFAYFVRMIRAMDDALLGREKAPARAAQPAGRQLSPELFDAVFG